MNWYDSPDNLVILVRYLVNERGFTAADVVHVLESRWKWSREFDEALLHELGVRI